MSGATPERTGYALGQRLKRVLIGFAIVAGVAFAGFAALVVIAIVVGKSPGPQTTYTPPPPAPPITTTREPNPAHSPALDKRLTDALNAAKTAKSSNANTSTPKDEFIEPAIREFGDANGNSWIDPYTFTDGKVPPATWAPKQ